MLPDKENDAATQQDNQQDESSILHNPFNPDDERTFSTEDLENEQKFKEALTERD